VVLALAAGAGLLFVHAQAAQTPVAANSASAPAAGQQANSMTANEAQEPEVTRECADLLKLATDLKAEIDKSNKDTLSLTVVRKASEIEQLAHKVRAGSPKN